MDAPAARPAAAAVPFLIGIAVLRGLTVEIDTFHGSDARDLPAARRSCSSATASTSPTTRRRRRRCSTCVMAGWGKLVGFELWKLRLLNVAISYGAALALLRLLRRTTSLDAAAGASR